MWHSCVHRGQKRDFVAAKQWTFFVAELADLLCAHTSSTLVPKLLVHTSGKERTFLCPSPPLLLSRHMYSWVWGNEGLEGPITHTLASRVSKICPKFLFEIVPPEESPYFFPVANLFKSMKVLYMLRVLMI